MNRGGIQEPVRDGKASILVYLDPDVRTAFEVATLKNGTTEWNDHAGRDRPIHRGVCRPSTLAHEEKGGALKGTRN
jgi:hypothetical protein